MNAKMCPKSKKKIKTFCQSVLDGDDKDFTLQIGSLGVTRYFLINFAATEYGRIGALKVLRFVIENPQILRKEN